jgi:hypothetical protein
MAKATPTPAGQGKKKAAKAGKAPAAAAADGDSGADGEQRMLDAALAQSLANARTPSRRLSMNSSAPTPAPQSAKKSKKAAAAIEEGNGEEWTTVPTPSKAQASVAPEFTPVTGRRVAKRAGKAAATPAWLDEERPEGDDSASDVEDAAAVLPLLMGSTAGPALRSTQHTIATAVGGHHVSRRELRRRAKRERELQEPDHDDTHDEPAGDDDPLAIHIRQSPRMGARSTPALDSDGFALAGASDDDDEDEDFEEAEQQYVSGDALLSSANDYFNEINREEKQLNNDAMRRLKEMKRANKKGGDKDGFKFVVPKTVARMAKAMKRDKNHGVEAESLQNAFGGDGVEETEKLPGKRKKRAGDTRSDFYQFQVWKQWTKNAEKFLSKGRSDRGMFAKKQGRSFKTV